MTRHKLWLVTILSGGLLIVDARSVQRKPPPEPPCRSDAVIVLDASGSMAGPGFGERTTTRIETARLALREVLPRVAPVRNLGLVVFGPGPHPAGVCANIDVRLKPAAHSAERILRELDRVQPYGQTPIAQSVQTAADVLRYRERPAVIVLLTDGEETCGGNPCALAQRLRASGVDTTVHVIGYMVGHASGMPTQYPTRCLPEQTGGLFVSADTKDQLVAALQRMLGCALLSRQETQPAPTLLLSQAEGETPRR